MKLYQLFILFAIGISSSLSAQIYSDINVTVTPFNNNALSPGMSIGYHLNNSLSLGAFAQSQLGENARRNKYSMNKKSAVYYGAEIKGSTINNHNNGWVYKGRIGFGNYKYDSHYEGAELRVNSFHEIFLGKHLNKKFSFGLGWRQSIETSDVFKWAGGTRNSPIGVFDRVETDIYNDFFLSMAYTIGKTARPTVQKNKAIELLNKLYLDFFVGKNLKLTDNDSKNGHLDQFELGFGFKITDDIGIGVGAFIGNDINTFSEEEPVVISMPISLPESAYFSSDIGIIGWGVQLRANPGKWHYKVEIGNVTKISTNQNQYSYDIFIPDINLLGTEYYNYSLIDTKTDGFNPYFNLHVGRTFWNTLTLSAGYTYVPNINYTIIAYEGADGIPSRARYHAPQIKLGFTLD